MKKIKCPTCGCSKFIHEFTAPLDENGMAPLGDLLKVKSEIFEGDDGNLFSDVQHPGNGRKLALILCRKSSCNFYAYGLDSVAQQVNEKNDNVETEVTITLSITLSHRKAEDLFNVLEDRKFEVKPKFPKEFKVVDVKIDKVDQRCS